MQVLKGQQNKNGGTKIWWGPSRTLSASTKMSVEQKMAEQKNFGIETLTDPKCKY